MAADDTSAVENETFCNRYNDLKTIDKAWEDVNKTLADHNSSMDRLTTDTELVELLENGVDGVGGREFGFWILHRHYLLNPGERIVEVGPSSDEASEGVRSVASVMPPDDNTQDVDRWGSDGLGLEYRAVDNAQSKRNPGPSLAFFNKFKDIMKAHTLQESFGLCVAGTPESYDVDGLIEQPAGDASLRKQITMTLTSKKKKSSSSTKAYYESVWVLHDASESDSSDSSDSSSNVSPLASHGESTPGKPSGTPSRTIGIAIRCSHKCTCTTAGGAQAAEEYIQFNVVQEVVESTDVVLKPSTTSPPMKGRSQGRQSA